MRADELKQGVRIDTPYGWKRILRICRYGDDQRQILFGDGIVIVVENGKIFNVILSY